MASTIEQDIKNFLNELSKTKTNNTIDAYSRDLSKFASYIEEKNIGEISKISDIDLMMYFMNLEKMGKSKNSLVRYVAVIRSFFEYMHKTGVIAKKVEFNKYKTKVEKQEREILSKSEFERFSNSINIEDSLGLRDKTIILLMYYHGIKPTNLIEIKNEEVDLNMGVIKVKNKMISLNKEIIPLIKAYVMIGRTNIIKGNESDYLMLGYGEKSLTRQSVWKILNKYRNIAKIEKIITSNTLNDSYKYHRVGE